MRINKYIFFALIFTLNIFNAEAQKQNDKMKITKINYRFGDSSVPPQYHRSYTVVLTKDTLHIKVDSYGSIISDTTYSIKQEQFDSIVSGIEKYNIKECKAVENTGCSGGTTKSLLYYSGDEKVFSGYNYFCGGEVFGTMSGEINLFASEIKKLIPNLTSLLKK